jgi:RecA/RadA recombinase
LTYDAQQTTSQTTVTSLSAFSFLQEYHAVGAAHDSIERQFSGPCLHGTRSAVLATISAWAHGTNSLPLCWLHGPSGSGKTTVATTVAKNQATKTATGSFFFSSNQKDLDGTAKLFNTVAYHLSLSPFWAPAATLYKEKLFLNPSILTKKPEIQLRELILLPCQLSASPLPTTLIVIDALDECEEKEAGLLIDVLARELTKDSNIRVLISSRESNHLLEKFQLHSEKTFSLDLAKFSASEDIRSFLCERFDQMYKEKRDYFQGITRPWPSPSTLDALVKQSQGLFMYASTLVDFVGDLEARNDLPDRRLWRAMTFHNGLNNLYKQVLSDTSHSWKLRRLLGALILLREPMPIGDLALFIGLQSSGNIFLILQEYRPILKLPERPNHPIKLIHTSLKRFFLDRGNSGEFFIDAIEEHRNLLQNCIETILSELPLRSRSQHSFPYACRNWVYHLHGILKQKESFPYSFSTMLEDFLTRLQGEWYHKWEDAVGFSRLDWVALQDDLIAVESLIMVTFLSSTSGFELNTKQFDYSGMVNVLWYVQSIQRNIQVCKPSR